MRNPIQPVGRAYEIHARVFAKLLLQSSERIVGTVPVGENDLDLGVVDSRDVLQNILTHGAEQYSGIAMLTRGGLLAVTPEEILRSEQPVSGYGRAAVARVTRARRGLSPAP